jgi:hypothetical protein
MAKKIDATKREDVLLLAKCLETTPVAEWWKVLGFVHDLGLMRFGQWPMRAALGIVRRFRGTVGVLAFFKHLQDRTPDQVGEFMGQTIGHLLTGKDLEDPKSAGGWSQREVDLLLSRVKFSMLEEA